MNLFQFLLQQKSGSAALFSFFFFLYVSIFYARTVSARINGISGASPHTRDTPAAVG
jgi:hypothetical protein